MATIERTLQCCGIRELAGITGRTPTNILQSMAAEWFENTPRAYIIFSCQSNEPAGRQLSAYIRQKNLGTIIKTKSKINPNSGNKITAWLWAVNNKELQEWISNKLPNEQQQS